MKRKSRKLRKNDELSSEINRQLIHVCGLLTIFPILFLERQITIAILGGIVLLLVILALYRLNRPRARKLIFIEQLSAFENWFERQILKYERPKEFPLRGAIYFYLGAFTAFYFFAPLIAAGAVAVLALADSLATMVGKFLGSHKLPINKQKSWEGSLVFFIAASVVLLFFTSPHKAVAIAFLTALVEMLPRIDDNLTIPLAVALFLTLF